MKINNGKWKFEIKNNEFRRIYSNEKLDVTIFEIKEEDNIDIKSFLEIDDQIFEDNINDIDKSIYLIGYPEGEKQRLTNGLIKDIDENNYEIKHLCKSNPGASGCSIINLNNNRVIGIQTEAATGYKWNIGRL